MFPNLTPFVLTYPVGTVAIVTAQSLVIAWLLVQRARRQRTVSASAKRAAALRASYERTRLLTGRLIDAQETARAEIARELHDDVCQQLAGVTMILTGLRQSAGRIEDPPAQAALFELQQLVQAMVDGIRRLSHDLHPASLRLVGPAAALAAHCREVEKHYDVRVGCRTAGNLEHMHPPAALCVFRIAQEALRNGAVHGAARRFAVSLVRIDDDVELTVTDDGRGFDLEAVRRAARGLGLLSMEERARGIGGDLHIITRPRKGTTIRVRIPDAVADATQQDDLLLAMRRPDTVNAARVSL